jgi:quercetin dioxygenase-like cupin family protein
VIVSLLGSSVDLTSGQVLAIEPGISHALTAVEASAILVTFAWTG